MKKSLLIILSAIALTFASCRKEPVRVACVGDSITFGHGVMLTRSRDAWPRILERKLAGRYEVLNYGISGATLLKEGNQPYRSDFWETAKSMQGEIYILMLGTNDSKPGNWNAGEYNRQLAERIRELKAIPSVKTICLMAPPPAFKKKESDPYAAFDIDPVVIRDEIRGIIRAAAGKNGVEFVDLYAVLDGHSEYMPDGVHPNAQGDEVIAETLYQMIGSIS